MMVYVVQEVKNRNILSAEKYGDLELLLPEGSQIVLSAGPTVKRLTHKLRNFNDEDYLLLIGDPSAIGIACAIAGIGGTGIVTIGAILGTAAQIDGRGAGVLDMTGLAQKGGSVKSFLRIFNNANEISTIRLSYNGSKALDNFKSL